MGKWAKNIKRDEEIVKIYLKGGHTLQSLGNKYKVTYQRIGQILHSRGIYPHRNSHIKVQCCNCKKVISLIKCIYEKKKRNNKGGRIFCSQKCFCEYTKKNRIKVKCLICNKEFRLKRADYIKSERHFCSRDCFYKYLSQRGRIDVRCAFCKKEFSITLGMLRSRLKNRKTDKIYCSRACFQNSQKN